MAGLPQNLAPVEGPLAHAHAGGAMPLHRNAPFAIGCGVDVSRCAGNTVVWQVRQTAEAYDDYGAFLRRVALLRRREFACAATGRAGLTYEEAVLSEEAAARDGRVLLAPTFSPALSVIQFSTLSLEALLDSLVQCCAALASPGQPAPSREALRLLVSQRAALRPLARGGDSVFLLHQHAAAAAGLTGPLPPGMVLCEEIEEAQPPPPVAGGLSSLLVKKQRRMPPPGCDAWLRMACAGEVAGPALSRESGPEALRAALGPPPTLAAELASLRPGTVKSALFHALRGAEAEGLGCAQLVAATAAERDWTKVGNPKNSILSTLMYDPSFVRLEEGRYALACTGAVLRSRRHISVALTPGGHAQ